MTDLQGTVSLYSDGNSAGTAGRRSGWDNNMSGVKAFEQRGLT